MIKLYNNKEINEINEINERRSKNMEIKTQKLENILKKLNIDGLFLTDMYNLRYFTGFTGTTGVALVTKEKKYFFSDFRYKNSCGK